MTELQKSGEELRVKRGQLAELAAKVRESGGEGGLMDELKAKSAEVNDLQSKHDALAIALSIETENERRMKANNEPGTSTAQNGSPAQEEFKSLGDRVTSHEGYKNRKKGTLASFELEGVDVKTLLTTLNGWLPSSPRTNKVVDMPQERVSIASLIPQVSTTNQLIEHMEETAYDNQAAAVAEGGTLVESGLRWTPRTTKIEEIGTFIPVTNAQLDDVPQIQSIINSRLIMMLQQREDFYLLNGNGTSPQIQGFMTLPPILVHARGADTIIDAVHKGIEQVETNGGVVGNAATVTGIVMHPSKWGEVLRQKTADGLYIVGNPVTGADGQRLWGVPVTTSTLLPVDTALLGDFRLFSQIARRTGITIEAGYINDQFISGQQSIRITERMALQIYRATAFCKVTGL